MKIAEVGSNSNQSIAKYVAFSSSETLLDYDIVFINLNFLTNSEYLNGTSRISDINERVLKKEMYEKLKKDIRRRDEEIRVLLKLGKCVFLSTPPPIRFFSQDSSGYTNFLSLFTFCPLEIVGGEGSNIDFRGDSFFSSFWNSNKDIFEYKHYYKKTPGKPLLFIKNTPFVVSAYQKLEKGYVFLLPDIKVSMYGKAKYMEVLFTSMIELAEYLGKQGSEKISLPAWSEKYKLPNSDSLAKELLTLEENLILLQQQIKNKKYEIENVESKKNLFAGTGNALEIEVRTIFESLGFSVEENEDNREDLILTYGSYSVVVETKGKKGSAAEKDAAQLEKWVNICYEKNDIKPKGILVVNAYNDRPLEERTEPAFPNQMLKFSIAREHCLITGLQLLCLYLDCKDDDEKRRKAINELLTTNGVFDKYQEWSEFICKSIEDTKNVN